MAPRRRAQAARVSPMRALTEQLTLTVEDAAVLLKLSRGHAYAAIERGEIPSIRIGRVIRLPSAALRQMLQIEPRPSAAE